MAQLVLRTVYTSPIYNSILHAKCVYKKVLLHQTYKSFSEMLFVRNAQCVFLDNSMLVS